MKTILQIMLLLGIASIPAAAEESLPDPSRESNVSAEMPETIKPVSSSGNDISTLSSDSDYTLNSLQIPRQIPPSPTAASLGIYGAVPVGHYTGIPQIEIPLYEIKCGSLTIPISLSYHASGIRVAAEAGWAGMGWTLNAGGAITRSVAGVDDLNDVNNKYLLGYPKAPDMPDLNEYMKLSTYGYELAPMAQIKPEVQDALSNMITVTYDTKPDVFCYNLDKYSGQMVFPKKAYEMGAGTFPSPIILNRDPIVISYHRDGFYEQDAGEWVVNTPDGAHYYFRTAERTQDTTEIIIPRVVNPDRNPQPEVYTAWYLDKIEGPYHEIVEFVYANNSKIQSQKQGYYNYGRYTYASPNGVKICPIQTHTYSTSVYDEIILREIRFPCGKIIFKTHDRSDLLYRGDEIPQALSEMLVINNECDTVKHIEFQMGYYNDRSASPLDRRLRLDRIVENGEKEWKFAYDSGSLPSKNSVEVDYWGYYNQKHMNLYYCPIEDIPLSMCVRPQGTSGGSVFNLGADRNAAEAALNGILTRIEYPTGGSSEFEYELHDFLPANSYPEDTYSEFKYKYEYIQDSRQEDDELIVNFTITTPVPIYCKTIGRYSEGLPCQGTSISNTPYIDFSKTDFTQVDPVWRLERKNVNGNWYLINQRYLGDITCADVISRTEAAWDVFGIGNIVEPGEYRIIMPTFSNTRANVEMVIPHLKEAEDYCGGGARIKCIRDIDDCNIQERRFTYCDEDGASSGIAHYYPRSILNFSSNYGVVQNYLHSSSNIFPGVGVNVAYSQMIETVLNTDAVACQIQRLFYNSYEPQLYRVFNSGVPQRIFHQNGRLKVIVRKNAMGEITHRTDYQYLLDEKSCDTIRGFHVTSFASSFLFTPYSHYAEWWYLDNERTTVWENGKPITSNTKYEYNNDYRKQVSKTTTYADREVVREESKHTCDVPTYSHMADMNRIFPVENNRYRNGKFVFGTRNDYDENLVVGNISQKTAEQPNYESRIRIKWYNGLYNPVYYVKDGTENVVCLWSYSGEYPIAEIKNATMDDVLKALGQEQGDLAYFTTLAKQTVPDMTPINSLRAKLPDAQVWTYTYKSLVGMLTATDPAGKTAYYDYDSFGRLTGMRDNDGNTIQSFDYHYKQ